MRCQRHIFVSSLTLVMEYCAGGSIADIMTILDVNLNEDQIAVVMHYVLAGLNYLHTQQRKIRTLALVIRRGF